MDNIGNKTRNLASSAQRQYVRPKGSLLNRFGRRVRHPLSRFFARQSLIETTPVIPVERFPQLSQVTAHLTEMQREARALLAERDAIPPLGEVSPDHRRIAIDDHWKSFFLYGYGYKAEANQRRCPTISQAINAMPGLVTAFLSIMEPGTHVPRHRGLTTAWVNCHLPLVLPNGAGRCEIAIDDHIYRWHEGEWLVFDDTYYHEVWNMTAQPRLVLLLQLRRPMRLAGRLAADAAYQAIRHSSFVQDVRGKLGDTSAG